MLPSWKWLCAFGAALLLFALVPPASARQGGGELAAALDVCGRGAGAGAISGTVTGDGGTPVANALVLLSTLYGDQVKSTRTDAQGRYRAEGLADGAYLVEFEADDYLREYYDDARDPARSAEVRVRDGQETAGIDAALARGGRIAGKVTAADTGQPLFNASVRVVRDGGGYSETARTDVTGVYTTSAELPAGDYRLRFEPASFDDYGYSYYGGSTAEAGAALVAVAEGATRSGVDIALARGASIAGAVTGSDGAIPRPLSIEVYNEDSDRIATAYALADGSYETPALPSGAYRLHFSTYGASDGYLEEYYNDKHTLFGADRVTVAGPAAVTGLSTVLSLGGRVSGTVLGPDGAPLSTVKVDVEDDDGDNVASGYTDRNGAYLTAGVPPGQYRVRFWSFGPDCDLAWQYYSQQGSFSSATLVTIAGAVTVPNIDGRLVKGGLITGRATAGGAGYGAGVEIFDAAGIFMGRGVGGPTGYWRTDGLPPGAYRLRFYSVDGQLAEEYYNNRPDLASADPISIGGSEVVGGKDVELTATPPAPVKTPRAYLPLLRR